MGRAALRRPNRRRRRPQGRRDEPLPRLLKTRRRRRGRQRPPRRPRHTRHRATSHFCGRRFHTLGFFFFWLGWLGCPFPVFAFRHKARSGALGDALTLLEQMRGDDDQLPKPASNFSPTGSSFPAHLGNDRISLVKKSDRRRVTFLRPSRYVARQDPLSQTLNASIPNR